MRKSKFTESQIAKTIKEVEDGRPVKSVCRELEDENAKLKRMYADLALEVSALKDVIAKML